MFSRYDDVATSLRDRRLFSNQVIRGDFNVPVLVNRDAPEHTRLRRNANHAFNARLVRNLGEWAQGIIDELMADALSRDRVEWVSAFTTTLPLRVVGEMLGVPLDRKNDLRRWSQAIMDMFAVAAGMDPDEVPGFFEDVLEFGNYMGELAQERRGKPNQGDILGELVAQQELGNLTRDELVVMAWSFIAAGYETTMNLLAGGMEMLLTDPGLAARLREDPDRTGDFIEEYLRLYSPIQWTLRRTTDEIERHGVRIPKDALVHMVIGAANRDPRKFADSEVFDLDRPNKAEHVGFGAGPHFCPGAALARMLADRAFRTYYKHLDRLSLDPGDPPQLRTRQGAYGIAKMTLLVSP
jgi:cytochrome P450